MSSPVLLATRSAGKLRELNLIFAEFGLEAIDLAGLGIAETTDEDSLESFETFEDNALAKARYFYDRSGGMPTFGDDSGMCVDALGGEPGVYSKRWSGAIGLQAAAVDDANNAKLLARMSAEQLANPAGFTDTARYVCVAAFKDSVGEETSRAELEGKVLSEPRGGGGFGYDPYFLVTGLGETFAEWTIEKTARSSHRSRAFRTLIDSLRRQGRL